MCSHPPGCNAWLPPLCRTIGTRPLSLQLPSPPPTSHRLLASCPPPNSVIRLPSPDARARALPRASASRFSFADSRSTSLLRVLAVTGVKPQRCFRPTFPASLLTLLLFLALPLVFAFLPCLTPCATTAGRRDPTSTPKAASLLCPPPPLIAQRSVALTNPHKHDYACYCGPPRALAVGPVPPIIHHSRLCCEHAGAVCGLTASGCSERSATTGSPPLAAH